MSCFLQSIIVIVMRWLQYGTQRAEELRGKENNKERSLIHESRLKDAGGEGLQTAE